MSERHLLVETSHTSRMALSQTRQTSLRAPLASVAVHY
jgi:hypothetical protein